MASEWPPWWRRARLGDVADLAWGDTSTTKAAYVADGIPAYSASGPDGCLEYADFDRTGIVLSAIGADCGKTWLAKGKWSCIKNTIRFWASDPSVDTEFLYWLTCDPAIWPKRGSAQPFISQGDARALEVAYPPLPEQRAIAHILGTLDDKIELNRRRNETLEAMARALFQSWFVDFDPVRAKAEGRDPGLPKPLADLFPDRFEDSELGEIPAGWALGTLADYANLNPETWSKETRPEVIEYVDLANTKWGRITSTSMYAQRDAPSRAQRVLRPGDAIIGTVRPGNGSYTHIADEGLTASTGFAVLRPLTTADEELVYLASTAPENIERLSHLADGAAYPAVRAEVVLATLVTKPPRPVIERFSSLTNPVLAKTAQNERESRNLAALRDALLPKLISGELRVRDVERFVAGATA